VYGRKPVLEVLLDPQVRVAKVVLDRRARDGIIDEILRAAEDRGVEVHRAAAQDVTRLSRNQRQDQGVVADVEAPRMADLTEVLARDEVGGPVLAVEGVTNPANLGQILRVAVAAGLPVVLPREGCPEVSPLVVKASAGTAFRARILRTALLVPALEALAAAGYRIIGLDARASESLWSHAAVERSVFVLGGESSGMSARTSTLLHTRLAIPMAPGAESLNVANAAAVVAFELRRRWPVQA
jgi:23S rRNA (guanosine2251-2'-O)-methyltransferase